MKATLLVLIGLGVSVTAGNTAVSPSARRAVKCAEAKLMAVKRKVDAKLVCQTIAVRKGTAPNPICIANAEAAFLKAFAKAEARGGCFNSNGESETMTEGRINGFIDDIGSLLIPCTPSIPGTPCGPSDCGGRLTLCLPDVSTAPVCTDTTACGSLCSSDATCEPGRACVAVLGENRCCDICE